MAKIGDKVELPVLYNWGKLEFAEKGDWINDGTRWFEVACRYRPGIDVYRTTPPPKHPRFLLKDTETGKEYEIVCEATPEKGDTYLHFPINGAPILQKATWNYHADNYVIIKEIK